MKKIALTSLLTVFVVSAASAATTNFIGGSANVATDSDHASVLSVAPEFGWKLNSKWDLGVAANFGYEHNYIPAVAPAYAGDAYSYGAGVFARYKVAQFGDVKLLLKGSAYADFLTVSPENGALDAETVFGINAAVIPMITYDLSESFTLYANLNFLGVYAGYNFKNKDLGVMDNSWGFGAGVNSDNVANTGNFQIGFNYNF